MSKFNVKQMHALIDELADAGQTETLTALSTIMLALARNDAEDSDLDLDDDDKPAKKKTVKAKAGRGRKAKVEADDEDEDNDAEGEDDDADAETDDDDDDLSGLDGLDVDDEDEKPAKKTRGRGRKAAEPDEDEEDEEDADDGDDIELPVLKSAKGFDAFLDQIDEVEDGFEAPDGGMRDHMSALSADFDIDARGIDLGEAADLTGKELRQAKTEIYGQFLAKMQYIVEQLVAGGDKVVAAVAKAQDVDLTEVKGRGKALLKNQAIAIVASVYGEEE